MSYETELAGDVVISCIGGQPGQVSTIDVTLTLNVPAASAVRAGLSEALVLLNEPATTQPGINAFRAAESGTAATC